MMKRSLIALLVASAGFLWMASTCQAQEQERNNQLGVGVHYWTTVKNIDVNDIDKNGFSYLAMYQYHYGWVGIEAALE